MNEERISQHDFFILCGITKLPHGHKTPLFLYTCSRYLYCFLKSSQIKLMPKYQIKKQCIFQNIQLCALILQHMFSLSKAEKVGNANLFGQWLLCLICCCTLPYLLPSKQEQNEVIIPFLVWSFTSKIQKVDQSRRN